MSQELKPTAEHFKAASKILEHLAWEAKADHDWIACFLAQREAALTELSVLLDDANKTAVAKLESAEARCAALAAALEDVATLHNCCVGRSGKWKRRGEGDECCDHHPDCRVVAALQSPAPLLASAAKVEEGK